MTPLIDGDILRYEIGAVGQYIGDDGSQKYRDFEWVASTVDDRIRDICRAVEATEEPIIYLSSNRQMLKEAYIRNFREDRSISKPYKGTRKADKPFHYDNLSAYLANGYQSSIANGLEADDLICIEQYSRLNRRDTIICSRDKDLRQCPGWHYGWECGKQPEFGPIEYDEFGTISFERGKIRGGGLKFFFAQCLTGDTVDNIGGLRGVGPKKAYELLSECSTEQDCKDCVSSQYQTYHPDNWLELLQEQSDLLWMVKELNEDGSFKHYEW